MLKIISIKIYVDKKLPEDNILFFSGEIQTDDKFQNNGLSEDVDIKKGDILKLMLGNKEHGFSPENMFVYINDILIGYIQKIYYEIININSEKIPHIEFSYASYLDSNNKSVYVKNTKKIELKNISGIAAKPDVVCFNIDVKETTISINNQIKIINKDNFNELTKKYISEIKLNKMKQELEDEIYYLQNKINELEQAYNELKLDKSTDCYKIIIEK